MVISLKQIESYNDLLSSMQKDIIYIIAKYRRPAHCLSIEEIAAEVNYSLIRYRDAAIRKSKECLTKDGFGKMLYAACRNKIRWTSMGAAGTDIRYFKNVSPNSIVNESGDTLFEFLCNSTGESDDYFKEIESSDNIKNLIKWIEEYSDFLKPNELKAFKMSKKGLTVVEIGQNMKTTHQTVCNLLKNVHEKIKSNIKTKLNHSSDAETIRKARKSINTIFS